MKDILHSLCSLTQTECKCGFPPSQIDIMYSRNAVDPSTQFRNVKQDLNINAIAWDEETIIKWCHQPGNKYITGRGLH